MDILTSSQNYLLKVLNRAIILNKSVKFEVTYLVWWLKSFVLKYLSGPDVVIVVIVVVVVIIINGSSSSNKW